MAQERKRRHLELSAAGIATLRIRANTHDLEMGLRAAHLFPIWEDDYRRALEMGLQRVVDAWLSRTRSSTNTQTGADSDDADSTDGEPPPC